jgi:hypothetical protein
LAQAPASPGCDTPAHHQFDFWVGDWDVYRTDKNKLVAHSKIEKLYAGCAVRENWQPLQAGGAGGSLNSYRAKSGEWLQVWTDATNSVNEYRGRWTGAMMDLEGRASDASEASSRIRMTFEPKPDGSVVQTGYVWDDKAAGWSLNYQFSYRPAHRR